MAQYFITELSLNVIMLRPDEDDIQAICGYILGNKNTRDIKNIAAIAAFILYARDANTEKRIFNFSDVAVLSRRSPLVIDQALQYIDDDLLKQITEIIESTGASHAKIEQRSNHTKATKKQNSRSRKQ